MNCVNSPRLYLSWVNCCVRKHHVELIPSRFTHISLVSLVLCLILPSLRCVWGGQSLPTLSLHPSLLPSILTHPLAAWRWTHSWQSGQAFGASSPRHSQSISSNCATESERQWERDQAMHQKRESKRKEGVGQEISQQSPLHHQSAAIFRRQMLF